MGRGHIPGSLFTQYHDLRALPDGLDPEQPVAAICVSGQRSAVAASLVKPQGVRAVLHVVEGADVETPRLAARGAEARPGRGRVGRPSASAQPGPKRLVLLAVSFGLVLGAGADVLGLDEEGKIGSA